MEWKKSLKEAWDAKDGTLAGEIAAFVLGRRYYANVVATRGTTRRELCCHIFRTREEADRHRLGLEETLSFRYVETVSFRSRKEY